MRREGWQLHSCAEGGGEERIYICREATGVSDWEEVGCMALECLLCCAYLCTLDTPDASVWCSLDGVWVMYNTAVCHHSFGFYPLSKLFLP